MIDHLLLLQLKEIGMSEYEAKVYVILSALRVASAREIHEQTKIPRGMIYETLTILAQKVFLLFQDNPRSDIRRLIFPRHLNGLNKNL